MKLGRPLQHRLQVSRPYYCPSREGIPWRGALALGYDRWYGLTASNLFAVPLSGAVEGRP